MKRTVAHCFVFAALALALTMPMAAAKGAMSLDERVACQAALEDIAWSEMLWPESNAEPKPSRSEILPDAAIRLRVEDQLRMEAVLAQDYGVRIDATALQRELDRMAAGTKAPDRLAQRFAVLGNEANLIAECVARPYLLGKQLRAAYAADGARHGALRERAQAALAILDDAAALEASGARDETLHLVRREASDELFAGKDGVDGANLLSLDPEAFDAEVARLTDPMLPMTGLRESSDHYIHEIVLARADNRIDLRLLTWDKRSFESWWSERRRAGIKEQHAPLSQALRLPLIAGQAQDLTKASADSWRVDDYVVPESRRSHTAVWTGSEMIVWGGYLSGALNTGGRYNPTTDLWTPTGISGAPSARSGHTAIWTGTEMIVWGGQNTLTGGRYNPVSDTWTPTATSGAPGESGFGHTAVWTGSEMIVWGGTPLGNKGGRYNPASDTWTLTQATGAPSPRSRHTAVWTGSRMVVWGGVPITGGSALDTGSRYNPATNTWASTTISGAPSARRDHSAIWTGSEMVVWGGSNGSIFDTGARYNPTTDAWTPTSAAGTPGARHSHTAVWTGSEMIIWAGNDTNVSSHLDTGGRYNPTTDVWFPTPISGAPSARQLHTAVWTGSEMIVWGGTGGDGVVNTGGRYNLANDAWTSTKSTGGPTARYVHTAIWTGSEMIVWGGVSGRALASGARYNPATDVWLPTPTSGAPSARYSHTAVWTGSEMLVWGGWDGTSYFNTGGRYSPVGDAWAPIQPAGAPTPRTFHTSTWTGSEMIVWGGSDGSNLNTGGRYNPSSDTWIPTPLSSAASPRSGHTAVWTGFEMIVWGGSDGSYLNTGARYDPESNFWTPTQPTGAPNGRTNHTAVWTGSEMVVWGGFNGGFFNTGGRYNPLGNVWTPTQTVGAPSARRNHTSIWTGAEMIVWGGDNGTSFNSGARYRPALDSWTPTQLNGAPTARTQHTAVWTGNEMIVWGGGELADNFGVYYPASEASSTVIVADTPDPSNTGASVSVSVDVTGASTAPSDGQVAVTASSGETCADVTPSSLDADTARFTCALTFASAGARTLSAAFSGSGTHDDSASAVAEPHAVRSTTTTAITAANPALSFVGQSVALNFNVTGSAPSGTVSISSNIDGLLGGCTSIAAGSSTCTVTAGELAAGTHLLTASFSGDANNFPSTSATFEHRVFVILIDGATPVNGIAGAPLAAADRPRVRVRDSIGNGVSGINILFAVTSGGGSATGTSVATGADGRATVGSWTLGANAGVNTMTASVNGPGPTTRTFTAHGAENAGVSLTKSSATTQAKPGDSVTYSIVVTHVTGPSNAAAVDILDALPSGLDVTTATWLCAGTGGATCGVPSGTGDVDVTSAIPVGGSVTVSLTATVTTAATGTLTNTAAADLTSSTDPSPANNIDGHSIVIEPIATGSCSIFCDGFEGQVVVKRVDAKM